MTGANSPGRDARKIWRAGLAFALMLAALSRAGAQAARPRDLGDFSLEELMNLQVTSVSAKEQKLSRTPASVFVITAEDIRRSTASNIPDLLRLVPGVNVEQIDGNAWAISIRGFSDRAANKVLVLVDGRSVYNPVYSGVRWDALDVPLADIDRIEVIRGPGGTVWGANAVNGVINIITKSADGTQGGLLEAEAGSENSGMLRYGAKAGRRGAYRVFGRFFNFGSMEAVEGGPAHDAWYASHGGFRSDWSLSKRNSLTVQGDFQRTLAWQSVPVVFSNNLPATALLTDRISMTSANILGRWRHTLQNGSEMTWQVYDDSFRRSEQGVRYSHNIVDIAFQHHVAWGSRQDVVWGVETRSANTRFIPGFALAVEPERKTDQLFSAFFQDEVKLTNTLSLTAGSKFEHNDYTGFEYEPSAQLLWTPSRKQAVWFSVARAIRQPSRIDAGIDYDTAVLPGTPITVVATRGNRDLRAERLYDVEAGYRAQFGRQVSLDLSVFSGFYRDLVSAVAQAPILTTSPAPPHVLVPFQFQNSAKAHSYGTEVFVNASPAPFWRFSAGYSAIRLNLDPEPAFAASGRPLLKTNTPENQFGFRSFLNLQRNVEWDHALTYVGAVQDQYVPRYIRLDTRLNWRIGESWELSVIGQNLLRPRHVEFPEEYGLSRAAIKRGVFGKITWHF